MDNSNPEVKIILRNIRVSAYKMRRVINPIRGRSYEEAVILLEFMPYRPCPIVLQLISSAVATTNSNSVLSKANLFISEIKVDEGSFLKRLRPRAQGRSSSIHKPTCHLTIILRNKSV
uniref:Large ribosomal subunit protein uL22c n=1 Tax=Dendrolycopodium obscurum TaxID=62333 RepID=A0A3Q9R2N5_DENOS|nr:ribosomal protein L22 [Dendrolycopodium obscurum]AZU95254.1 ribosomal protein L22 [Dendrolycopodium obscurum]